MKKALFFTGIISIIALSAAVFAGISAWRDDFCFSGSKDLKTLPKGWEVQTKIGTPSAEFYLSKDEKDDISYLHMESDKATASAVCNVGKINLRETPYLSWRWRVNTLPSGADGRDGKKDDQAIGIYVGTGSMFSKKSVSYRWDTETPKGAEGTCAYGAGTIKIKWFTLRNKEDASGEWVTEQRNVAEDFHKAWGFYPEDVYVSVSCNSQYTASKASADLNWIEITSAPASKDKK